MFALCPQACGHWMGIFSIIFFCGQQIDLYYVYYYATMKSQLNYSSVTGKGKSLQNPIL